VAATRASTTSSVKPSTRSVSSLKRLRSRMTPTTSARARKIANTVRTGYVISWGVKGRGKVDRIASPALMWYKPNSSQRIQCCVLELIIHVTTVAA
jgi:hypothetical protein